MRRGRLIEHWFPVEEVGVESRRETGASSALPPHRFLHVWWARRPLTASRAAILGSLLPAPAYLDEGEIGEISPEDRKRFLAANCIHPDIVSKFLKIQEARALGIRLDPPPYRGIGRAFSQRIDHAESAILSAMHKEIEASWGGTKPVVLDLMAGGGSIPLESVRLGMKTLVNELNPVAAVILHATLEYPTLLGDHLLQRLGHWGNEWLYAVRNQITPFFHLKKEEDDINSLWARTYACPHCGHTIPLSPNWWLERQKKSGGGSKGTAVRPTGNRETGEISWEIVDVPTADGWDPKEGLAGVSTEPGGTWNRKPKSCIHCGEVPPKEAVHNQARSPDGLGHLLYAVRSFKKVGRRKEKSWRLPTQEDMDAVARAEEMLAENWARWDEAGLIPTEDIPAGDKTAEAHRYGFYKWADFFSPRQLLTHLVHLEELLKIRKKIEEEEEPLMAKAVATYLAFVLDGCCDYNALGNVWDPTRAKLAHVFSQHDYSMKWSYGETGLEFGNWALKKVSDSVRDLAKFTAHLRRGTMQTPLSLSINQGDAALMSHIEDHTVHAIVFDPPYYDNVMYAELADFFYVWMKRSIGNLYPNYFLDTLSNKDSEAVARTHPFKEIAGRKDPETGKKITAKQLAHNKYERLMARILKECLRVLHKDGVLTMMFTHKKVGAWDALCQALITAGFEVSATWPVHAESEHSLHIRGKAAASTMMLIVCRPRVAAKQTKTVWWQEILPDVERAAREKAASLAKMGIRGLDLYLACFGPALQELTTNWPVLDKTTGEEVSPTVALDAARQAVVDHRFNRILKGREPRFDAATQFTILSWDAFGTWRVPFDDARKLAMVTGIRLAESGGDISALPLVKTKMGKVNKAGGHIVWQRLPKWEPPLSEEKPSTLIESIYLGCHILSRDDGAALEKWLDRTALRHDTLLPEALRALLTVLPPGHEDKDAFRHFGQYIGVRVEEERTPDAQQRLLE